MAIQLRGGTAAAGTAANPVLAVRQLGVETDTGRIKVGDGATAWNALPYSGGTFNSTDAQLRDRTTHVGEQPSTSISDFAEAAQDAVAGLLVAGANVTVTYDDTANTLTIAAAGTGVGLDAEGVRDTIGAALIGTAPISVVVDDAADTITITTAATVNSTDAFLRERTNHIGQQPSTSISDFNEAVQDAVAALLVAGANVTLTYDDVANTLTVAAAGTVATPDATTTTKGVVQLAGDLGGTAALPIVLGLEGKAPTSRLITAGTGLTGGGSLAADRTLAVAYGTTAATALQGNHASVTNARTPTAHATSHAPAAADDLTATLSAGTAPVALAATAAVGAGSGFSRQGHVHPTSGLVRDTTNQTIAGVKTFSSPPIVPTPIGTTDAANKSYADAADATLQTSITDLQTTKAESSALASYALLTQVPVSTRARLSSDFSLTNGSNTLQNVTGLSWSIAANVQQDFSAIIHYSGEGSGVGGADFRLAFTGPAGCALTAVVQAPVSGSTGVGGGQMLQPMRLLADVVVGIGAFDIGSAVLINGTFVNGSTAGTIQFRAAQNVAVAVTTPTKVLFGSLFLVVNA